MQHHNVDNVCGPFSKVLYANPRGGPEIEGVGVGQNCRVVYGCTNARVHLFIYQFLNPENVCPGFCCSLCSCSSRTAVPISTNGKLAAASVFEVFSLYVAHNQSNQTIFAYLIRRHRPPFRCRKRVVRVVYVRVRGTERDGAVSARSFNLSR